MPVTAQDSHSKVGFWLSTPNVAAAEIGVRLNYGCILLDVEHGTFDLATLDRFIPFLKGLKLGVFVKVLGPQRGPIQQALDFGADGVFIPHIESVQHAREVTSFAKFAPVGRRGFAGGRTTGYGGFSDEWIERQNAGTLCFAMIEHARALEDVEQIASLNGRRAIFGIF